MREFASARAEAQGRAADLRVAASECAAQAEEAEAGARDAAEEERRLRAEGRLEEAAEVGTVGTLAASLDQFRYIYIYIYI